MAFACFSWFIVLGYSFIFGGDGWHQHFVALVYYAKYLRGIIRNLINEHQLIIPDWDFYIGEGADIVNVFHYYVIGDPLTLLSVFVPSRYMQYFYSVLRIKCGALRQIRDASGGAARQSVWGKPVGTGLAGHKIQGRRRLLQCLPLRGTMCTY